MDSDREESPDWLRSFQAPKHSSMMILSDTESSLNVGSQSECTIEDEKFSPCKTPQRPQDDKNIDSIFTEAGTDSPVEKISTVSPSKRRAKVKERGLTKRNKLKTYNGKKDIAGNGSFGKLGKEVTSETRVEFCPVDNSVLMLSSDSDSYPAKSSKKEGCISHEEPSPLETSQSAEKRKKAAVHTDTGEKSPSKKLLQGKSPKKRKKIDDEMCTEAKKISGHGNMEVAEEETTAKPTQPNVSSSRLPLVLPEKVNRLKALVESEGESIDMSGDMGAVGRIIISDAAPGNQEMFLDLKGTIYKTAIIPSRTFCIVSFGPSEAKIEAMMNDFIRLTPQSNVYEGETMVEGTLDGFSFDSENEADNVPKATTGQQNDNEEGGEEQTKGKANKTSGVGRKRGKAAGGKPSKKMKKKPQATKRAKPKK